MSIGVALVVLVVLLLANAFFVGAEFALISVRRDQVAPEAAQGSAAARVTLKAIDRVGLMMGGCQLGITACSLGIGAVGEPAVAHLLEVPFAALGVPEAFVHPVALVIALGIVVFLHMVLGEMVPKNVALAGPLRTALVLGPVMYGVCWVVRPVIALMNATANGVLRLMRVTPKAAVNSTFTRDEVAAFVDESGRAGLLDDDELNLLTGALAFETQTAADVALDPATLVTVPREASVDDLDALCASTGFSRFPVEDGAGGFAGYVHVKDLLTIPVRQRSAPVPAEHVHALSRVQGPDPLRTVVTRMQADRAHLAVVEGVGPRRLVALEDVLEELVGEVTDATRR